MHPLSNVIQKINLITKIKPPKIKNSNFTPRSEIIKPDHLIYIYYNKSKDQNNLSKRLTVVYHKMRSRVYIGTVFEFEDWKETVNQLWSVAAPRALDGQLE